MHHHTTHLATTSPVSADDEDARPVLTSTVIIGNQRNQNLPNEVLRDTSAA